MKKIIILILFCCSCIPPHHQEILSPGDGGIKYPGKKCIKESILKGKEYDKIDSILFENGLKLSKCDSVLMRYENAIIEYFTKNMVVFRDHDTVSIYISYQGNNRICCAGLNRVDTTIKEDLIKNINNKVFPDRIKMDSSLFYSLEISQDLIKTTNGIIYRNVDYGFSTINRYGRSRASIMRIVMSFLPQMRYAYNRHLREIPGIRGKITVKFAINEFGTVIYAEIINSTINYCPMENEELNIIYNSKFDKINSKHDLTTVVYPFVFSQ
jgi:hypothetical protein